MACRSDRLHGWWSLGIYKDLTAYELRKDADSLPDLSALVVFLGSEQVCVLQGREYVDGARELYIRNLDSKNGSPTLPIGRRLSRILKGVFGLSDAPREKSLTKEGWHASTMDAATFFLWSRRKAPLAYLVCCAATSTTCWWRAVRRLGLLWNVWALSWACVLREGNLLRETHFAGPRDGRERSQFP